MLMVTLLQHTVLLRSGKMNSTIQHESSKMHHEVIDQQPTCQMKVFELFTRARDAHDRQISAGRVADELGISEASLYEIISDYVGMKKVCMRSVPKLLTLLQCVNRVDCCEELLKEYDQNLTIIFGRIVTKDEIWIQHYDPFNQQEANNWKKPGDKTPIRPRVT